jgi:hypothetical protein
MFAYKVLRLTAAGHLTDRQPVSRTLQNLPLARAPG